MSATSIAEPGIPQKLAYLGVLVACVGVGYWSVATSFFVADDFNYLNICAQAETLWDGTAIDSGWMFFRPGTALSFWFNHLAFGHESATSYHLVALVCHVLNAYLIARLTWRFVAHPLAAAFAGAAFAVFPVHPECITWISARADVLSAVGTLMMVTGWLDYQRGHRGGWALVEVLGGFVAALATKDSAMILPVALIALFATPRLRPVRSIAFGFGAVVLVLIGYLAVRFAVFGGFLGPQAAGSAYHSTIDLANAVQFTVDAMRLMLLPGPSDMRNGLCMVLALYLLFRHPDRLCFLRRAWPLAVLFLLQLAPVANIAELDARTLTSTRFLYMPSMFFCVGLGVLLGTGLPAPGYPAPAAQLRRSQVMLVTAAALVVVYAAALQRNNRPWAEASRICETMLEQLRDLNRGRGHKWVFIHDVPDSYEGAYVFRNGLDTAIKLFVSPELEFPAHGKIDRKTWDELAAKRRADPSAHPEILLARWDAATRRLIEP